MSDTIYTEHGAEIRLVPGEENEATLVVIAPGKVSYAPLTYDDIDKLLTLVQETGPAVRRFWEAQSE